METHSLANLTIDPPPPSSADWNDHGVVIIDKFFPENLLVAYEECWLAHNSNRVSGWPDPIPYMRHEAIRDLLCWQALGNVLSDLISDTAALHLNLTGWVSTERDWHQDSYLNPPWVGDYYAAVWIALDSIDPDSGPFQYVPGSHRWPQVTRENILSALPPDQRDHRWPKFSEQILSPLFEEEIVRREAEVVSYLPKRGDLLVWHGRLLHRGSRANIHGLERRSLIAHYSGAGHRPDMPIAQHHKDGGWYFPLKTDLDLYYGPDDITI